LDSIFTVVVADYSVLENNTDEKEALMKQVCHSSVLGIRIRWIRMFWCRPDPYLSFNFETDPDST
jgi:hypothetical protein